MQIFFCWYGSQALDWDKESLKRLYSIRTGGGASRTWNSLEGSPIQVVVGLPKVQGPPQMGWPEGVKYKFANMAFLHNINPP
jgi:hypothetical protein